jgi:hypothetical protein
MSMWPALLPGDLVRAVEADGNSLEPGAVVVIEEAGGPFIHRFVRYARPRGLRSLMLTAGDGSGRDRPRPIPERVLEGRGVLRSGRWRAIPGRSAASYLIPRRMIDMQFRLWKLLSRIL